MTSFGTIGLLDPMQLASVSIHDDGKRIYVGIDDVFRRVITDSDLGHATGVGLVRGAGGTSSTQWRQFEADVKPLPVIR